MTAGVCVLGSTGSIGVNTLNVIRLHSDRYHVESLSANQNHDLMLEQCKQFRPKQVVMVDPDAASALRAGLKSEGMSVEVFDGEEALGDLAQDQSETVVCGIVGAAGLLSTIAAVESGKKVLIANKEPLVMLGEYITDLSKRSGACLLPLDSEHNAIFQCLPQRDHVTGESLTELTKNHGIRKILLTGSGGPFRSTPLELFPAITPEEACNHPNWSMGKKISIDSATMMNKGLELIEACVLFGVSHEVVDIVIHPQSIVHSMVEYIDGSVLAQLGSPDMRVPIANALAWPERIASGAPSLSLIESKRFDFEAPDEKRFPALTLAREAADKQGSLPAVMNAANEVAVSAFLERRISFDQIVGLVAQSMEKMEFLSKVDVSSVLAIDRQTRSYCSSLL